MTNQEILKLVNDEIYTLLYGTDDIVAIQDHVMEYEDELWVLRKALSTAEDNHIANSNVVIDKLNKSLKQTIEKVLARKGE